MYVIVIAISSLFAEFSKELVQGKELHYACMLSLHLDYSLNCLKTTVPKICSNWIDIYSYILKHRRAHQCMELNSDCEDVYGIVVLKV